MPGKSTVTIPAAEFQALKDYLAAQGFTPAAIAGAIGAAASGRSRSTIASLVTNHLRTLPKKAVSSSSKTSPGAAPTGGGKG